MPVGPSVDEAEDLARAERLIAFLDASPEPFHVVSTIEKDLLARDFVPLNEGDLWGQSQCLQPGGKYFYTRNRSTIVAFTVGAKVQPGRHAFKVIGAHTDSPVLKVKPRSKRQAAGITQVNVECYGGGLWHTWFDRDLSVAGRAIVRTPEGGFEQRLVRVERPILRVPTLCIHLQSAEEREAFKVNKEDHLAPVLCSEAAAQLGIAAAENSDADVDPAHADDEESKPADAWAESQEPELLRLLADELGCRPADIADFELSLYDTQGAALCGGRKEFVTSARLDNLASCFVAVEALNHHADNHLHEDEDVSIVALFDHEEVGSNSAEGAGSPVMRDAVERICHALQCLPNGTAQVADDTEVFRAALARSMIFSVDQAHAVHPNYASKHEKSHGPVMNGGVVIKSNSNQRYATNAVTGFIVRELARRADLPVQEFCVRNDCPCGSTIGPVIAANTGIRAVDLGMPQLSMHSCREMMGKSDLTLGFRLFAKFLSDFRELDEALR